MSKYKKCKGCYAATPPKYINQVATCDYCGNVLEKIPDKVLIQKAEKVITIGYIKNAKFD